MTKSQNGSPALSRRSLLGGTAAVAGALVVGFWVPPRANAQIINPAGAAWVVDGGRLLTGIGQSTVDRP